MENFFCTLRSENIYFIATRDNYFFLDVLQETGKIKRSSQQTSSQPLANKSSHHQGYQNYINNGIIMNGWIVSWFQLNKGYIYIYKSFDTALFHLVLPQRAGRWNSAAAALTMASTQLCCLSCVCGGLWCMRLHVCAHASVWCMCLFVRSVCVCLFSPPGLSPEPPHLLLLLLPHTHTP